MKIKNKYKSFLAVGLLLTSCSILENDLKNTDTVKQEIEKPELWASAVEKNDVELNKWLETFDDSIMLGLIKEGQENNLNLKIAAANMDKAWLLAEQSGVALKPNISAIAGAGASSGSRKPGVGLRASWELDVWGRISAGVDAAEASARSIEADYMFASQSLSANVAKAYLKSIEAKKQGEIVQKNITILEETMRITKVRYDNGMSSGQDVALNEADLESAKEKLITIEGAQRDALRALEVLLGRYPNASVDIANALPKTPSQPPAGIPSDILERRPDIIAAESKIASAFNASSEARAARLPKFALTSSVSNSSSSLSDMMNPGNAAWQLQANLLAPLYDGGKRKIDVKISNTEHKKAVANYVSVALIAFSEVENNLDAGGVLAKREKSLEKVFTQSTKAYKIAKARYDEGEVDMLEVLIIQQKAVSAESDLLTVRRLQLEQRINLYLALGGSW